MSKSDCVNPILPLNTHHGAHMDLTQSIKTSRARHTQCQVISYIGMISMGFHCGFTLCVSQKRRSQQISLRSLELINASRLIWPDRLFRASQKFDCEHIKNMSVISCGERSAFSLVKAETGPVITEPQ